MKKIILILVLCSIIPIIGKCTNPPEVKNTKPIFSQLLEKENINSYQIPTFLVRFALNFSDESEVIKPIFKGSRFINLAVCVNETRDSRESYRRICKNLDLSTYQNLVDFVDSKSNISIKALLDNKLIRELVFLVHDENGFIALSMTGKIDIHCIADAIVKLNKSKSVKF